MQEDMKDFVTSQPAAGALFTVVGELCYFSVATFHQKLEKYAEGGDGGLTRATMRVACGLPAEDVALHPDGASHGSPFVQARAWWRPWRRGRHLVPCVSREALTGERLGHHVSRLRQEVWPRVPARDRVGTLLQLKARGWWKELPQVRGAVDPAHPGGVRGAGSLPACARRRRTRRTARNAVGRPLCLLVRVRRPHQAPCQIAGGMRREGEPQGSLCDERDGRGGEEK